MVRNILPLVILAFVFFLQGLAPKVRTVRKRQHQQASPALCVKSWMAKAEAIQTGLLCPWGRCIGQSPVVCNVTGSVDRAEDKSKVFVM